MNNYYVEIRFWPISIKPSMLRYTNILTDRPPPHNMAISQILKGQLTFWAQQFERYNRYKASSGNPLKYGWGILNLIFRCQCHLRHQPKIVQWHPISLLLKRSGYIHLLLEQCFKSGDVIDMCEWRRILDFCRRGLFNDKITSEMYFLCQS